MLLAQNAMLPGVGTYSAYAGHMPDDLLELVSICRKEMYKAESTNHPGGTNI